MLTNKDYKEYKTLIDKIYFSELDRGAKFLMNTSLTPALLTDSEANGFIDRYKLIIDFWNISQNLFKKSLKDKDLKFICDLVLNEVNPEFGLEYHKRLYEGPLGIPHFFRTDESAPGKISEIQSPGSGWGTLQALQQSLSFMRKRKLSKLKSFNKQTVAEKFSKIVNSLTSNVPYVFHQIDESSVMVDTNYFISVTRKYGLKYLGHDWEVTYNNAKFIRTHSFMEQATSSLFPQYLKRFNEEGLVFDIFPSILFFQKIPLIFPFWEKTRHLYNDDIREIFPFTSLVTDHLVLEDGSKLTIDEFCKRKPHERDYYLKYGGADGSINWGSKAVFHLGKTDWKKCKVMLENAAAGYKNKKQYWILQKSHVRKEKVSFLVNNGLKEEESYGKWSGFYGPTGFLGGYVMSRGFYKVHGQDDTVCRLLV